VSEVLERAFATVAKSNWQIKSLGDVCRTSSGGTPSRSRPDYFNGNIRWVKSGELTDGLVSEVSEFISEEALAGSSAKLLPADTLLIAMYGTTVGKLGVLTRAAATNQAVCAIFPPPELDPKFLFWYLRRQRSHLIAQAVGGAQPNIIQTVLRDLELPIPPLGEQREIVAEIEKQFSRLDEAVANLQRGKANLKRYKASVLKAAVEDRLVVVDSTPFQQVPLSHIVQLNPRLPKASLQEDTVVSFVPMAAVGADDGRIGVRSQRPYSEVRKGYTNFRDGDVLFAKVTPCMENGKVVVAVGLTGGVGFGSTEFHVLRPRDDMDPSYVYYLVSNDSFRKEAVRHMTGAVGLRRVPTAFLKNVVVSVPTLAVQKVIVAEVDRHLSIVREVEAEIDTNLKRAQALRQATLAKAFAIT